MTLIRNFNQDKIVAASSTFIQRLLCLEAPLKSILGIK